MFLRKNVNLFPKQPMNSKKKKRNRLIEGICFVSKDKKNKVTKKRNPNVVQKLQMLNGLNALNGTKPTYTK